MVGLVGVVRFVGVVGVVGLVRLVGLVGLGRLVRLVGLASASVRSAPWKLTAPIGSRDDLDGKLSVRRVLTREPSRPRGSGQNRAITAKIAFETPEKRVERSAPASKPD